VRSKPYDILSEPIDIPLFLGLCTKLKIHCVDSMHALNRNLSSSENEP